MISPEDLPLIPTALIYRKGSYKYDSSSAFQLIQQISQVNFFYIALNIDF